MAENSRIEWTTHTFNPWRGCTKVSDGCKNCYAETMSKRNLKVLGQWGPNGTRVVASESMWREPLKWDKAAKDAGERHRVFCASPADVFEGPETMPASAHELINNARYRLFDLINRTSNLDWLLLTKRPENIDRIWPLDWKMKTPENVWIGTSVEDQKTADERIPHLLKVPAAVRFLSCEPLLEETDLRLGEMEVIDGESGYRRDGIDWVIVGGESGHNARMCEVDWITSIRDQCEAAGVPCFIKQLGAMPVQTIHRDGEAHHGRVSFDVGGSKGGDWDGWPAHLRVREFPTKAVP